MSREVSSPKFVKLKKDLKSKKEFWEIQGKKYAKIIQNELNNKLHNKIDSKISVLFRMGGMNLLPYLKISIHDVFIIIDINWHSNNAGKLSKISFGDLDRTIIGGFLAQQIKNEGKTFIKIDKYFKVMFEISREILNIREKRNEEKKRLQKEYEDRRLEIFDEVISPGVIFVLNENAKIGDKTFKNSMGVVLNILGYEKRSILISVEGNRKISKRRFTHYSEPHKYTISKKKLIEDLSRCAKEGSNPAFDRAMVIAKLLD